VSPQVVSLQGAGTECRLCKETRLGACLSFGLVT